MTRNATAPGPGAAPRPATALRRATALRLATAPRFAAALLTLLGAAAAHADNGYLSPTDERFRLSLGVMRVGASTALQIDSSSGTPGTYIDAENDFGLESKRYVPKFEVMLRAGNRNRLWLDYFALDRSDTKVLTKTYTFRNTTLMPGDPALTDASLRAFELTYGYSFLRGQKFELAATLGLNAIDVSARVRVATAVRHIDESENEAGPYPLPGLAATWAISQRFYVDARAQYLKVAINHLSGSLAEYEFNALYRLRPNISFALGYSSVKANLDSTQAANTGQFHFDAKGPQLFVRVAF